MQVVNAAPNFGPKKVLVRTFLLPLHEAVSISMLMSNYEQNGSFVPCDNVNGIGTAYVHRYVEVRVYELGSLIVEVWVDMEYFDSADTVVHLSNVFAGINGILYNNEDAPFQCDVAQSKNDRGTFYIRDISEYLDVAACYRVTWVPSFSKLDFPRYGIVETDITTGTSTMSSFKEFR